MATDDGTKALLGHNDNAVNCMRTAKIRPDGIRHWVLEGQA